MATLQVLPQTRQPRRPQLTVIEGGLAQAPQQTVFGPREAILARKMREESRLQSEAAAQQAEQRRGRVVPLVRGAAVVAFLLACLGGGYAGGVALSPDMPAVASTYTVQAGDTLWDIAGTTQSFDSRADAVEAIRQLNHLGTSELAVGQTLKLPR
ncbi:MAG: LysM peptidoglycan-binding domain-containing protein [Actinomycetaceae bacterium]|nr:LysM peptidoglycan-binding domain-containing protein [Actinomycetaceae bacterium]MDU0970027.1 LysM peptidoglycan-binding domain-containing protein [Actinomycetaceae bacterium]